MKFNRLFLEKGFAGRDAGYLWEDWLADGTRRRATKEELSGRFSWATELHFGRLNFIQSPRRPNGILAIEFDGKSLRLERVESGEQM